MSESATRRRGLPGGRAAVADKHFRRPDVRPGKRRRLNARVLRIGGACVLGCALVALGVVASSRVVDARFLSVDRVTVQGTRRLSASAIDALIGEVRGGSLLRVDLKQFQARLLESPWVAAVTVRRIFPSTIDVRIVEREPVAIARLKNQLFLVDGTGVIIDAYGPQYADFDLPIVDGMAAQDSTKGAAIDRARAQLVAKFLDALSERPELRRSLSQVNVSRHANVAVLIGDDPTLLYLGDDEFVERLRTYLEIRPRLLERMLDVEYVDLRGGLRVVVKPRK